MKKCMLLLILLGMVFLTACSNGHAGATSETTNGVAAVVVLGDGTPVVGASVYLREASSLRHPDAPEGVADTETDDSGKYFIADTAISNGRYTLEVRDTSQGLLAVQQNIVVEGNEIFQQDTLLAKKTGTLVGMIADTAIKAGESYVQVYGLDRAVFVDSTGTFEIAGLPVGGVHIRVVIEDSVEVAEADSFTIKENGTTDAGVYAPGLEREIAIVIQLLEANNLPIDTDFLFKVAHIPVGDNHIREINLDSSHLDSLLPTWYIDTLIPEVGNLRVHSLSLAGNNLSSLPNEIGNLVELYYLDVSFNNLTVLPEGVGNMVLCNELDIENNLLTSLPETIYQLENLETIHVQYNRLVNLSNKMRSWISQHTAFDDWYYYQTP